MPSYSEGREARRSGAALNSNPYPEYSPAWGYWRDGWNDSDTILRALGT